MTFHSRVSDCVRLIFEGGVGSTVDSCMTSLVSHPDPVAKVEKGLATWPYNVLSQRNSIINHTTSC